MEIKTNAKVELNNELKNIEAEYRLSILLNLYKLRERELEILKMESSYIQDKIKKLRVDDNNGKA